MTAGRQLAQPFGVRQPTLRNTLLIVSSLAPSAAGVRIADAVDKYKIPTVKVTGGQRIDLLGVKKEDLVNVWKDIGMPSGHAYAKALRTVKTCVGSEWCRMGTQDSTQMGKDLEKAMCGCTDASHQETRDAIREQKLLTIASVYSALGWRTPEIGRASCRERV